MFLIASAFNVCACAEAVLSSLVPVVSYCRVVFGLFCSICFLLMKNAPHGTVELISNNLRLSWF